MYSASFGQARVQVLVLKVEESGGDETLGEDETGMLAQNCESKREDEVAW